MNIDHSIVSYLFFLLLSPTYIYDFILIIYITVSMRTYIVSKVLNIIINYHCF